MKKFFKRQSPLGRRRWGQVGVLALAVFAFTLVRVQLRSTRDDGEERLAYLAQRISHHDYMGVAPGHPFDGEWRLGVLSTSSIAATNLAMRDPSKRAENARLVSQWARLLASDEVRAYDTKQWGSDALETLARSEAHAGYLGHLLLAMDAACLLGGERDEQLHRAIVDSLARRIANAPEGLIETYPGEIYVPDNVVVMAGIMQFDVCMGFSPAAPPAERGRAEHAPLYERWEKLMRARWIDEDNGLLVFAPGQPARGSGAAWNSFFLPLVNPAFAAEQSPRMWRTFGDSALAGWLGGIDEAKPGDARGGDVDSGPLILGVSPSATGFALADATLRDRPERDAILHTAELVGFTWGGQYVFSPLVGDAITLAAKTMTPWRKLESSQKDYYGVVTTPYDRSLPRSADDGPEGGP
ncbi:MAG: hypothetical protein JNM17_27820 [Archangium sp.]|nr:hypothetical protein [Archangium sp.]